MARLAILKDGIITAWIQSDSVRSCWIVAARLQQEGLVGHDDVTGNYGEYPEASEVVRYLGLVNGHDTASAEQLSTMIPMAYGHDFDGVVLTDGTRLICDDVFTGYYTEGDRAERWCYVSIEGFVGALPRYLILEGFAIQF